jgi:hypothetical protein
MSNRQGQEMTMDVKRREGQLAYDAVMRTDPLYPQYKKILEADGQAGTTTATGYRFPSKDANDAATGIFKNFALNLDKDKLNAGVIGIQKVDGTPFEPEDYAKVKSDAEFATWILDPSEGNKLKFIYNVGKVTTNTKGEVVGEKMLVKTDALPGAEQLLVKTGQLEPLRILFGDRIGALESSDRKTTTFEPVKGYTVEVERLNKSEIDNKKYGAATAPYRVTYTSPNGKKDSYPAPDQEAVIEAIMSSLKK